MTISVIIPTKNRHQDVLNTLESVYLQTCLPDEIIIVDQSVSSELKNAVYSVFDGLDEKKKNKIILKYIHDPQITGLTHARNRGIEKNESDIVLFLDDDVILEQDFIFNILEIYRKYPEVYGVSGTITNVRRGLIGTFLYKFFMVGSFTDRRLLIYSNPKYEDAEYIAVSTLPGGLTSYRKEVFQEFAFDENFVEYGLSEDLDFSFRVSRKYKLVITPRARLEHVYSAHGRLDLKKLIESLTMAYYYFFKKNLDKNLYNYLCYIWLNIGYICFGAFYAIFKQNTDVIIGYISGLKKIIKGENCDFIQSYKG